MKSIKKKENPALKSRKNILRLVYAAFFTALIVVCYISFYIRFRTYHHADVCDISRLRSARSEKRYA